MQKYPNGMQFTYINDPTHQLEIISYSAATNTYRIKWVAGKYKGQSDTISESFLLHVCTMHNQMHPPSTIAQPALLIRASVGDTVVIAKVSPMCAHEWKDYFGLNERYNYCTKCNKKQAET